MSLRFYLKQIESGKPIDFPRLLACLPADYKHQGQDIFAGEKVSANRWRVSILDEVAFKVLQGLSAKPLNRLHAGRLGDTHKVATSATCLLVYHAGLTDPRPDVVYLDETRSVQGFTSKKQLLIIENEENFFQYRKMLESLNWMLGSQWELTEFDLVLGSGNKVTARLHYQWLEQYNKIYCAFDFDLGGLTMFATLHKQLGDKVELVGPKDYTRWLPLFRKKPETTDKWIKAMVLAEQLGFEELASAFRRTSKFMEQEVLLKD